MKYHDQFGKQALTSLSSLLIMILISSSCEASIVSTAAKNTSDHDDSHENGENIGFVFYKTTVRIYNDLDDDLQLEVHCKSKEDDLGVLLVPNYNFYEWTFRINFGGTTLFFCGLSWKNASGTFDIYDAHRDDQKRCSTKCYWRVGKDGVHGYRQGTPYPFAPDLNFPWPKPLNPSSKN
ncbi:Self-incompatibility protein [Parasponia andersonii]|uniref:S-protein homolog n=1 Tax=Parasponia andersonii TaxID=3476 RepID=A0A2P5AV83_PARAD|nr:Self-incompatibility protein [Parasponia andersonii]